MFVNLFQSLRAGGRARLAALLLAFLALAGAALTPDLPPDGDDVSYVTLAQALASGRGYVNAIYPGDPPELQYPPLFPLLLTPLVALFGPNLLLLKLVPALAGALALLALFALLSPRLGPDRAFLIAALTGLNGYFLSMSTQIMSETVYAALSAAALILICRAGEKGGLRTAACAGLAISAAIYARTIGVALALAGCGTLLLCRRRREALTLSGVVLLLLSPWLWRSLALRNSYIYQLFDAPLAEAGGGSARLLWLSRLLYNAPRYAGKVMGDLFFHPFLADVDPYHPLKVALSLVLTTGIAVGLGAAIRKAFRPSPRQAAPATPLPYMGEGKPSSPHTEGALAKTSPSPAQREKGPGDEGLRRGEGSRLSPDPALLYLPIYLGICLIWPYHDTRFLLPVLPFLIEHGLRGAEAVGERLRFRRLAPEMAGLLAVVGFAGCLTVAYENHAHFYTDEMARYREACLWVQGHAPPEAVLLCRKPREAAFWSGRKAWWYTGTQPAKEVLATARRTGATHLLINDFPIAGVNLAERASALLREGPFRLVHQTDPPQVRIYEIRLE